MNFQATFSKDFWILGLLRDFSAIPTVSGTHFITFTSQRADTLRPFFLNSLEKTQSLTPAETPLCPWGCPPYIVVPMAGPPPPSSSSQKACTPSYHDITTAEDQSLLPDHSRVGGCERRDVWCCLHWPHWDGDEAAERPTTCSACSQHNLSAPCITQKLVSSVFFLNIYSKSIFLPNTRLVNWYHHTDQAS